MPDKAAVEKLWTIGAIPVDRPTRKKILTAARSAIARAAVCGRAFAGRFA
jgi:hypothetical protein